MASASPALAPASGERVALVRSARSAGLRSHGPSLVVFLVGCALSAAAFLVLKARTQDRQRAAFNAESGMVVANLRASFELPLEVLAAATALFAASDTVTRAEFARFVRPALERYPGIRALEYVPVVQGSERERYEREAQADGLTGFGFRQLTASGAMVPSAGADEYLPIYFMEPSHPLVLGFDCLSEPVRKAAAERARSRLTAASSERLRLFEDPPSVYSIAVFQPVFDDTTPRTRSSVRGLTVEVFRVRSLAERAIEEGQRRRIEIALLDLDADADKRVLFESEAPVAEADPAFRMEAALRFADRNWSIVLTPGAHAYAGDAGAAWLVLLSGVGMSGLLGFGLSAVKTIRRLRGQVREAQQFGQYTLLERLGEGGMGVVYKARHALLRRPTAIKLLAGQDHDPARVARFEREVQLTSELTHPNTIAIYDYGRTPAGVFYYAMEHIDGVTLEQLVQSAGPLPAARVSHFIQQAASALHEAHGLGLIHRDIKPANLMLCRRGGIPDFVKVMDFGLVKDLAAGASGGAPAITRSTEINLLGTPSYLAPEAIAKPSEVDARVDLYALGAVAYYLLVGQPVFTGESIVEVCGHHLHTPPVPPSERTHHPVPPALERLILRCLEKDPTDRFPSMEALLHALRELTGVGHWSTEDASAWWRERGDALIQSLRDERQLALAKTAGMRAAQVS